MNHWRALNWQVGEGLRRSWAQAPCLSRAPAPAVVLPMWR